MRQGPVPRSTSRTAVAPPSIRQRAPSVPLLFGRHRARPGGEHRGCLVCAELSRLDEYDSTPTATNTVLDLTVGATRSDNVRRTAGQRSRGHASDDRVGCRYQRARALASTIRSSPISRGPSIWMTAMTAFPIGYLDGIARSQSCPSASAGTSATLLTRRSSTPSCRSLRTICSRSTTSRRDPQLDLPLTAATRLTLRADYSIVTSDSDSLQVHRSGQHALLGIADADGRDLQHLECVCLGGCTAHRLR